MNLLPYAIAWGVLAVVVLVLAIIRWQIGEKEEDSIHLSPAEAAILEEQVQIGQKLNKLEQWGKSLTIVLVITGIILAGAYGWQVWEASATVGLK